MRCSSNAVLVAVALSILNTLAATQSTNIVKNVLRKESLTSFSGHQQLVEQNFLFGIASLGVTYENQTQCGQELEMMLNAITKNEVWGLKGAGNMIAYTLICVCLCV